MSPKFHKTMDTPSNRKFSRIAVIGSITMLQGALYLVLSIWALLVIICQFDMTSTNIGTIMYFIYFRNSDCIEVSWSRLQSDTAELPKMTFVAERTEGLIISYMAISFLWILTSIFVIVGATRRKLSHTAFHCYFTPWAIVILAGCLLDVIATAFHIYDIIHTTTAESTFQYLEVENFWNIIHSAEKNFRNFSFPSIIFACVSSRLVVLFLFNVFGMLWAIRQATKLILKRSGQLQSLDRTSPQSMEHPRVGPQDPNQYYYVPARAMPEPFAPPPDLHKRTFEHVQPSDSPVEFTPQDLYALPSERKQRRSKRQNNVAQMHGSSQAEFIVPRPRERPQPPEKRYSGNAQGVRRVQADVARAQSDRYPEHDRDGVTGRPDRASAPVERPNSSYVTGELRSQLPWSYFSARDDITTPRKTLAHAEDHEVLPPVPVPDYTLHFPRKDRYTIQDRAAQLQASTSPPYNQSAGTRW